MTTKLLTDKQIAEMFGVSTVTVWRCVKRGVIPRPLKFGRCARWTLAEIEASIDHMRAERDSTDATEAA